MQANKSNEFPKEGVPVELTINMELRINVQHIEQ